MVKTGLCATGALDECLSRIDGHLLKLRTGCGMTDGVDAVWMEVDSEWVGGDAAMAGFENDLTQLESVVQKLERGELTLDESVRLFEEGMKLSQACRDELEKAEGRIQVLVEGKGGKMQAAELELAEQDEAEIDVDEDEDE
jgi:exodeoxyribonuclease VII small subunit